MSLTGQEITAGKTYTVRIDKQALSFKRGNDAVALIKSIDGRCEAYLYDPQNPAALRTGYVKNESTETATSKYDGTSKTWTVHVPTTGSALSDLQTLASAYDAEVAEVTAGNPAPAPAAPRERRFADWAEYGSGFGPDELDAMSAETRRAITGDAR